MSQDTVVWHRNDYNTQCEVLIDQMGGVDRSLARVGGTPSPGAVIVITAVLLVDHATCALGMFALASSEYTPIPSNCQCPTGVRGCMSTNRCAAVTEWCWNLSHSA
jgi:hypothetical protein